jgi:hypothetical protein
MIYNLSIHHFADCSSYIYVHGPVLCIDVHGTVHPAGHERHRRCLHLWGIVLRCLSCWVPCDSSGHHEVRPGLADRVLGYRHHGTQHCDCNLRWSNRCLGGVHQWSIHGLQVTMSILSERCLCYWVLLVLTHYH